MGTQDNLGQEAFYTRDLRLYLTALVVEHLLSSHEVAQGYKAVKERSAVVRFKVAGEDAYFLAWTTTPWTLPSNVALCVNPEETYCKVKAADGYAYYMAKALLDKVLGKLGTGRRTSSLRDS